MPSDGETKCEFCGSKWHTLAECRLAGVGQYRAEKQARRASEAPSAPLPEPPTLESLWGIAPDLTGGLDSVEYVRRYRNDAALGAALRSVLAHLRDVDDLTIERRFDGDGPWYVYAHTWDGHPQRSPKQSAPSPPPCPPPPSGRRRDVSETPPERSKPLGMAAYQRAIANRELDAMIAERIMGVDVEWRTVRAVSGDRREPRALPHYSTDIWSAMDALGAVGGIVKITRMAPNEWRVAIGSDETWWAETLPLAICRALLGTSRERPNEAPPSVVAQ